MAQRDRKPDEILFSGTPSVAEDAAIARACLRASDLENMNSEMVLRQSLSVGTVISTTSSFARHWQSYLPDDLLSAAKFQQIGEGLQGVVFELTGTNKVVKVSKLTNREFSTASSQLEFDQQSSAYAAFRTWAPRFDLFVRDTPANLQHREIGVYLLDFGRCTAYNTKSVTPVMLRAFAKAILGNDPYFPSPDNKGLWAVFEAAYIRVSEAILEEQGLETEFPRQVMQGIKDWWESH